MTELVLGLFKNEDELRDEISLNLGLLEPGLLLININYAVRNSRGADGSFDILAKDKYGNFVIIEVKRSEVAARQALHELSKYISLFMEDQKVDKQKIRCFVVSTHWHELDVPLSYFRENMPVDVKGFTVDAPNKVLRINERVLPPIDSLPKLCPDARFLFFETQERMLKSTNALADMTQMFSQIRAALVLLEPLENETNDTPKAVLCVWRIADSDLDKVASFIGVDDSDSERGYYEGWSAETLLLDWFIEQCEHLSPAFRESSLASPEKIAANIERYRVTDLVRLGGWSSRDLVNDLDEVVRCLVAKDVSSVGRRSNRYFFNSFSSPKTGKSWEYTVSAFKSFVGFVEYWRSEVELFLSGIPSDCDVDFFAHDCRHFHYCVYQKLHDDRAGLSQFKISVKRADGELDNVLLGGWAWDGLTHPTNAVYEIKNAYGSLDWSRLALFSAVDTQRYESAFYSHGFYPYVIKYDYQSDPPSGEIYLTNSHPKGFNAYCDLAEFIKQNTEYCAQVANLLTGIPPNPSVSGGVVLIPSTGS